MKNAKNHFFVVQIEKTAKNNLHKEWRKKPFLLFTIQRKTIFESLLASYGALTPLIKIHRQFSHVMQIGGLVLK